MLKEDEASPDKPQAKEVPPAVAGGGVHGEGTLTLALQHLPQLESLCHSGDAMPLSQVNSPLAGAGGQESMMWSPPRTLGSGRRSIDQGLLAPRPPQQEPLQVLKGFCVEQRDG